MVIGFVENIWDKIRSLIKDVITYIKDFFKKKGNIDEAVIIACYYNPNNNPYRLNNFLKWYDGIKQYNHRIIECVMGNASKQLPENPYIATITTDSVLWHKETLLNKIIKDLEPCFKYVFWLDTDIIFTNKNWLQESVDKLQYCNILQPFEYCVHLEKDETIDTNYPSEEDKKNCFTKTRRPKYLWRSFGANYGLKLINTHQFIATKDLSSHENYDLHGHVGFAWGAKREILDTVPLYEKGLVGGSDHLIAHSSGGHFNHTCITKSFKDNLDEINQWIHDFNVVTDSKVGYTEGTVYHLWHGSLEKRQYLKRIQDTTKAFANVKIKDENGLYVTDNEQLSDYVKSYLKDREDTEDIKPEKKETSSSQPSNVVYAPYMPLSVTNTMPVPTFTPANYNPSTENFS